MNGIEKITEKIIADAKLEVEEVLAAARKEAEVVSDNFAQREEKERTALLEAAKRHSAERESRMVSVAELEGRKRLLSLKQEMIDQAFAAARGRAQDDVVAHHERHERLLLVRPQLDTAVGNPVGERLERLLLGELRVCVVQMVGKRAQLAGLVAFGLRGQRLDDVLAFERMNISHRAVPLQSMQNLMRSTCHNSKQPLVCPR